MTSQVVLDQTLHGYRNGHRLLAGSLELDGADRRFLANVTDSPDAGKVRGWDALLAGYPLPSGRRYCLSMTWPDLSGRRRGAVATHTLLLDRQALARARKLPLLSLFSHPGPALDGVPYRAQLQVRPQQQRASEAHDTWLTDLTWVLHTAPVVPVDVITEEPQDSRHAVLLELWLDMWPALRSTFVFAEAPAVRKTGLSLPPDMQFLSRPQGPAPEGARILRGRFDRDAPDWAKAVADPGKQGEEVRRFLDAYGPGAKHGREALAPLAEVWLALRGDRARSEAQAGVMHIDRSFPEPEDVAPLKAHLLKGAPLAGIDSSISPVDVLCAVIDETDGSFGADLAVQAARDAIARESPASLIPLLSAALQHAGLAASAPVIDAFAQRIRLEPTRWSETDPKLLARLIRSRFEVATESGVWKLGVGEDLWRSVRQVRGHSARARLVRAMMLGDADVPQTEVVSAWPDVAVNVLDSVMDMPLGSGSGPKWAAAVPVNDVSQWAKNSAGRDVAAFRRVVGMLPADFVMKIPMSELSKLDVSSVPPGPLLALFLRAVEGAKPIDGLTATRAYERLHGLALRKSLDDPTLLDSVIVDVPLWDRARRLARILNQGYVQHSQWRLVPIEKLSQKPFEALLSADSDAALAQRIATASLPLQEWQLRIVSTITAEKASHDSVAKTLFAILSKVSPF